MKKNSFRYNESNPDDFEDVVDLETGAVVEEKKKPNKSIEYKEILEWSEKRRGKKFMPHLVTKQFKVFLLAGKYGISHSELKQRWMKLEEQKFWADNGFDWMNVLDSFNKKPK